MPHLTQNGVEGFVYWQDENLVHIEGRWVPFGQNMAAQMEVRMRDYAFRMGDANAWNMERPLCPACYMLAGYNMLVALAQKTGQNLEELGRSMAQLFSELADSAPPNSTEAASFPYRNELKVYAFCPLDGECDPFKDSPNTFAASGQDRKTYSPDEDGG